MPDGVDHRHDHEAKGDRDAEMAKLGGLGAHHYCAGAGKDERERAYRLRDHRAEKRHAHEMEGLRRSRKTTSRQTPRSCPIRSRTPTTRKPTRSWSRRLASFSGKMPV